MRHWYSLVLGTACGLCSCHAQHDHTHESSSAPTPAVSAPKIFLDKSPRIVEYQLKRLDNQRLLLVQRETTDKKYIPVYSAILSRVGMSPGNREEAVEGLVILQQSDPVNVLLTAIEAFDADDREARRAARELGNLLLRLPAGTLSAHSDALYEKSGSEHPLLSSIAVAALVASRNESKVIAEVSGNDGLQLAFLTAIPIVPRIQDRNRLRPSVLPLIAGDSSDKVRRAAITALGSIKSDQEATFDEIAPLVRLQPLRDAAVPALLKIPTAKRGEATSRALLETLVEFAEQTPAEARTSDSFVDAMQLADQLLAGVPAKTAKTARARLDAVTVRMIRIRTVEEEMRYDVPHFAVQAGKSVQVVLENHDLMPHNLVIAVPGALKEVAQLGLETGPRGGWKGLPYVPESDKVLHATKMIASDQQDRITFTAPETPGEYPYVCTFPQHWYRMYGVMVVVDDLDQYMRDPFEPANPIGSNRTFVQAWTVDDLKNELEIGLRGRSPEIGKRIFVEASCAGCHKAEGEGGVIGPDLTDLFTRWKGDRVGVLREILDPSHKVDAKYVMQRILTVDGLTVTGLLVSEDDDNVTLISSAEAKEPTVIAQDDIEIMVPSSVSMMPKALMDQYTKDEIFELMAYLESIRPAAP